MSKRLFVSYTFVGTEYSQTHGVAHVSGAEHVVLENWHQPRTAMDIELIAEACDRRCKERNGLQTCMTSPTNIMPMEDE